MTTTTTHFWGHSCPELLSSQLSQGETVQLTGALVMVGWDSWEEGSLNNSSTENILLFSWSVPQWPPLHVSYHGGRGGLFIYFLKATGRSLAQPWVVRTSPQLHIFPQDKTIGVWLEKDLSLFISQPALGELREPCLHFGVWVEELACCSFLFLIIPKGPGRICAV